MTFTSTVDPHLYGLERSVTNILMIGLFHSNSKMIIFFSNRKFMRGWGTRRGGGEGREGVMKLVISCGCHKCMTPKSVKFTTNSITRGSSFFFKSKPQGRYILTAYITPLAYPLASFPTHYSPHSTELMPKEPKHLRLSVGTWPIKYSFLVG